MSAPTRNLRMSGIRVVFLQALDEMEEEGFFVGRQRTDPAIQQLFRLIYLIAVVLKAATQKIIDIELKDICDIKQRLKLWVHTVCLQLCDGVCRNINSFRKLWLSNI